MGKSLHAKKSHLGVQFLSGDRILQIDDFGLTTPLDFVICLQRMLVREPTDVTDVAPKLPAC